MGRRGFNGRRVVENGGKWGKVGDQAALTQGKGSKRDVSWYPRAPPG